MRAIDINQIVIVRDVEPTFRGHLPCQGLRGGVQSTEALRGVGWGSNI